MSKRWIPVIVGVFSLVLCGACVFLDIKPVPWLTSEGFALLTRKDGDSQQNAEAAYDKFDRAVSLDRSCAVCYFGRGASLYRQFGFWVQTRILDVEHPGLSKDLAEIIRDDFTRAIQLDPNLAEAYYYRGLTLFNFLHRPSAAAEDFTRALALERPEATHWGLYETTDVYYWRGMAYAAQEGMAESAVADFTEAVALAPEFTRAYYERGLAYMAMSRKELLAIRDFTTTISLDPSSTLPFYYRAILRAQLGSYREAIEDMDHFVNSLDCAFSGLFRRSYPDVFQGEDRCAEGKALLEQWQAR